MFGRLDCPSRVYFMLSRFILFCAEREEATQSAFAASQSRRGYHNQVEVSKRLQGRCARPPGHCSSDFLAFFTLASISTPTRPASPHLAAGCGCGCNGTSRPINLAKSNYGASRRASCAFQRHRNERRPFTLPHARPLLLLLLLPVLQGFRSARQLPDCSAPIAMNSG